MPSQTWVCRTIDFLDETGGAEVARWRGPARQRLGYLDLFQWFPTIVAIVLWVHARVQGVLYSRELLLVPATCLIAFGLQTLGRPTVATVGLVLQVGVAIYLLLRLRGWE